MGRLVEGIGSKRHPADEMGYTGRPAEVINWRSTRPSRWIAGGIRPSRWVVGGLRRTPRNKHQDPEVVRETVKGWRTPAGCGEIQDEIER